MHSFLYVFFLASAVSAFVPLGQFATISVRPTTPLARGSVAVQMGRGNLRDDKESKRQSRVSQLMRGEIAQFVRLGSSIKTNDPLPDTLRERISVVDVHMSPDLRSAKVFVSVFGSPVEKRQCYAWLVAHAPAFKHALSQSLKDMKGVPEIHFKQTDISAAVDVMATIERLAVERQAKEDSEYEEDGGSMGVIDGLDFDYEDDLK